MSKKEVDELKKYISERKIKVNGVNEQYIKKNDNKKKYNDLIEYFQNKYERIILSGDIKKYNTLLLYDIYNFYENDMFQNIVKGDYIYTINQQGVSDYDFKRFHSIKDGLVIATNDNNEKYSTDDIIRNVTLYESRLTRKVLLKNIDNIKKELLSTNDLYIETVVLSVNVDFFLAIVEIISKHSDNYDQYSDILDRLKSNDE